MLIDFYEKRPHLKYEMLITVQDKMQQGYCYRRVAPMGQAFAPDFRPDLSPKEMLALGVFEGHYLTDCQNEFPPDWFQGARLNEQGPDLRCNFFGVKARLSLTQWREKGWIYSPDPRGWFQWYCRYYSGRRIKTLDALQIQRWRLFRRHLIQVEKNCLPMNLSCRRRQRQALLQWAYSPFI